MWHFIGYEALLTAFIYNKMLQVCNFNFFIYQLKVLNAHAQILRKQIKNTLSFIKYNEIK